MRRKAYKMWYVKSVKHQTVLNVNSYPMDRDLAPIKWKTKNSKTTSSNKKAGTDVQSAPLSSIETKDATISYASVAAASASFVKLNMLMVERHASVTPGKSKSLYMREKTV